MPYSPGTALYYGNEPPSVLVWLRVMCGFNSLMGLAILAMGFIAPMVQPRVKGEDIAAGVVLVALGVILTGVNAVGLWAPRKPWMYGYGIFLAIFPMVCGGCWPLAILVLIGWFKPETKAWFQSQSADPDVASTFR